MNGLEIFLYLQTPGKTTEYERRTKGTENQEETDKKDLKVPKETRNVSPNRGT